MKKMIFILAAVTIFTACNSGTGTETPTTDSTVVKCDSTGATCDTTKACADSAKTVDTTVKAK